MKDDTNLEKLVEQCTAQTVSVRVSAYRILIQKFTEPGCETSKLNWSDYSSEEDTRKTLANFKSDLANESDDVSYEAAGACGCLLASESFLSMLQDADQKDMVDNLLKVVRERKAKIVIIRSLWSIAKSKLSHSVYQDKAPAILKEVSDVLQNETSATAALEALQVIHSLMQTVPDDVIKDVRVWFSSVFKYLVHEAYRVRIVSFIIINSLRVKLEESSDDLSDLKSFVVSSMTSDIHSRYCKKMIELVAKENADVLKSWRLIVQVLGLMLHSGTSLINDLLEVVEKGFKSGHPELRVESFKCWKTLIDNFSLDENVLMHHKRLKLLLAPLKANNAKTEAIAHEKLVVWWHLVCKLKAHGVPQFDTVVVPLLKFCFNGSSAVPSGGQGTGLAQRNLMMSMGSSPGRRFSGLHVVCAEVLAQLLSSGVNIPQRQPFVFSISSLEVPLLNDALFVRMHQLLWACASEAFHSLGVDGDNKRAFRQNTLGVLLIQAIVTRTKAFIKHDSNKKESVEQVKEMFMLFSELEQQCRPGDNLSEFVFKFYEIVITGNELALPLAVINSRQYSISTGNTMQDMMSGTLINHLIHQLCKPSMLHCAIKKEEYFTVWITVLENSKPPTGKLGFLQWVLKELDNSIGCFGSEHSDTLRRLWAVIVRQLLLHIEQTQVIDQGDGMEHDWSCIYNMLMFPVFQSVAGFRDANEEFNQRIMVDWSELWSRFTELTPLVATAEPNCEVEFIARGMLNLFKKTITGASPDGYGGAYNLMANILHVIVEKMRYSELGKSSIRQINSPAKPKKKPHPLHNLSGCVELFEVLFVGLMRMGACPSRMNTALVLCESVICIFKGVRQEKLLNPLITEVIVPITEGFKINPFIRFNHDVGKHFVKIVRSFSLMFEEHIGKAHTADHLNRLEPLLRLTLTSSHKEIKQAGRQMWKASFASTKHSIPSALYEALKECSLPPASLNDSQSDLEGFNANPKENVPENIPGSFLKRAAGMEGTFKAESPKSKFDSPKGNRLSLGTPKLREKKVVNLHELREEEFVKVSSPKPSRRVLTEHQMEKFKERKEIPALYSDLSQSASQIMLPAQFASQNSFEDSSLMESAESRKADLDKAKTSNLEKAKTSNLEKSKTSAKDLSFSGFFTPEKKNEIVEKDILPSVGGSQTKTRTTRSKVAAIKKSKASNIDSTKSNEKAKSENAVEDKGSAAVKENSSAKESDLGVTKGDEEPKSDKNSGNAALVTPSDTVVAKKGESVTVKEAEEPKKISEGQNPLDSEKLEACKSLGTSKSGDEVEDAKVQSESDRSNDLDSSNGGHISKSKSDKSTAGENVLDIKTTRSRSSRKQAAPENNKEASKNQDCLDSNDSTPKQQSTPSTGNATSKSRGTARPRRGRSSLAVTPKSVMDNNEKVGTAVPSDTSGKEVNKSPALENLKPTVAESVEEKNLDVKKLLELSKVSENEASTPAHKVADDKVADSGTKFKKTSPSVASGKKKGGSENKEMSPPSTTAVADSKRGKGSETKTLKETKTISPNIRTYPGKKKDNGNNLKRYSSCDSDYTDEDLDEELRKTSIVLQESLNGSVINDEEDTQFLAESSRRKNQTPSKKTVEDVRKALKGKGLAAKTPSDPVVVSGENMSAKSPCESSVGDSQYLSPKNLRKRIPFKEVEVSPSVVKDARLMRHTPKIKLNELKPSDVVVTNGELSDTESEDPIPSSQDDDDGPLCSMARRLSTSRLNRNTEVEEDAMSCVTHTPAPELSKEENVLLKKENVDKGVEDKTSVTEKSPLVLTRGKRKRNSEEEEEEDVEEKSSKRRKNETVQREASIDDSVLLVQEDTDKRKKSYQKKGEEAEKPKKFPRRGSNSSEGTPSSQNSNDLFDSNPMVTTPPKVTRSGRKIVAPKKDMPEPMTPPHSMSVKRRSLDLIPVEEEESPNKSKKSPSLLTVLTVNSESERRIQTSAEKKTTPKGSVVCIGNDVPKVIELEAVTKRNVQKKITDMFSREVKQVTEEETLPEMEGMDTSVLEGEINVSEVSNQKSLADESNNSGSVKKTRVRSTPKQKEVPVGSDVESSKKSVKSGNEQSKQESSEKKTTRLTEDDKLTPNREKGAQNVVSAGGSLVKTAKAPPKKRELSKDVSDLSAESEIAKNCDSVEIVTSVPESMDIEELNSPGERKSPSKTDKIVLSPKKKWVQTAKEFEMADKANVQNRSDALSPSKLTSPGKDLDSGKGSISEVEHSMGKEMPFAQSEKSPEKASDSVFTKISEKDSDKVVSKSPEKSSDKPVSKSPEKVSDTPVSKSPESASDKQVFESPEKASEVVSKSPEKASDKLYELPGKVSDKVLSKSPEKARDKVLSKSPEKASDALLSKSPEKNNEAASKQSPEKAGSTLLTKSPEKVSGTVLTKSVVMCKDSLQKVGEPVESEEESDLEVDVEMVDEDVSTKDGAIKSSRSVAEKETTEVIDISSSLSPPVSNDASRKDKAVENECEKTKVVEENPGTIIVLSSDKDSSDDTVKSSSKSSESSSLESGQRVDEELKEVERKRSKKDKVLEASAEEIDIEEDCSPEKATMTKFATAVGTPERQKKLGNVKYAGSRAALLVACAKQNIKNRGASEGDSPSKLTVGDAIKFHQGHSPLRKSTSGNVSPGETPPTPSRKRKLYGDGGKPWVKHEPSPGATPSPGILKKSVLDDSFSRENTSPPSKQRRVSFADPPVSDRVEIPPSPKTLKSMRRAQKRLDMTKADSPIKVTPSPSSEQESQPEPDSPTDVNCSQPLYPALISCHDVVDRVATQLTSPFLFEGLKSILEERGIRTVGDLCRMTEADVNQLPIKTPKIALTLKVLQKYEETRQSKKKTDVMLEDVEAQLNEIFGEDHEDKEKDHLPSSPRVDTAKMTKGAEVSCASTTVLHSGLEDEDELAIEDGITPLDSSPEEVSCETINAFCKQVSDNPKLLDVLVKNLNEDSRQELLQRILVELPYGAVLDTYFEYLRKRDLPHNGR